jgi:RNA polymerase sigma-70 factor (ECF subfamily)
VTGAFQNHAGDETFDDLQARYFNDLRGFVGRRIADRDIADDITQETFFRAIRSRGSFDPRRPVWPWLIAIARNLMRNRVRDEMRRSRHIAEGVWWDDLEEQPDGRMDTDPEETYSVGQDREAIAAALTSLPERHRRMLLLRALADLSYEEIAQREGVSVDASKSLVKRARKAFREAYVAASDQRGTDPANQQSRSGVLPQ